jgi:hypothetical protein
VIKAPNIMSAGTVTSVWPLPQLVIDEANSVTLLDALCIASQVQMGAPDATVRRAWRERQNAIHAELRKRLAPEAGK